MDGIAVRRMEVPNAVLLGQVKEAIREGHTATINVKGYSMRPFLEHCRDKVRLASFTDLKVGDAVLAEFSPDKYVLHRIIEIDGDVVVMMGDGNAEAQRDLLQGGYSRDCHALYPAGQDDTGIRPTPATSRADVAQASACAPLSVIHI